jgi:hypothetical protein
MEKDLGLWIDRDHQVIGKNKKKGHMVTPC